MIIIVEFQLVIELAVSREWCWRHVDVHKRVGGSVSSGLGEGESKTGFSCGRRKWL